MERPVLPFMFRSPLPNNNSSLPPTPHNVSRRPSGRRRRLLARAVSLCLLLGCLGCRTSPPVGSGEPFVTESAPVPEALRPRWVPFAETETPALAYFEGSVRKPRLKLWALRVDLEERGITIVVNGAEEPRAGEGIIPSTRVSSFVKRYNCLAGINANPFSPVSGREGEDRTITGITLSDGRVTALPYPSYDALLFYDDGVSTGRKAEILNQGALAEEGLTHVKNAVGGFRLVLRDGAVPEAVYRRGTARHPRSAAGLSADGRILYLLVVDGRRPGSIGATEAELGILLKQLGADSGLNFDGGGSTALALRFPGGKVGTVNTPIHGGIPGRERGVATCLGIGINGP